MKEQKKVRSGILSLTLGLLFFCGILLITIISLKTTGDCYASLRDADLSQETEASLYYNDHLYASMGFGISILPDEIGKEARLASFLSSGIRAIGIRILNCGILYSMMAGILLQYFLFCKFHSETKKYFLGSLITSVAPFAVFAAAVFSSQKAYGLPVVFPDSHEWFLIAVGLTSVFAGNCCVSALLSAVRRKRLTAVLAVPVVFCLFILGMNFEMHLYTAPTKDSFAYFYETHPEVSEDGFDGDFYYDEEKNAILLDGVEYLPETVDNPDYYTGRKRAGAFLFEFAYPYSGNELLFTETVAAGGPIPPWTAAAYVLKAAVWTALSFCFIKRRRIRDAIA